MSKRTLALLTLMLVATLACAEEPKAAAPVAPESDDEKTVYALGFLISQQIGTFSLDEKEKKILIGALEDGLAGRQSKVDGQTFMPKIQALAQSRATRTAEIEKKTGSAFLEKAAAEKGAKKLDTGVIYQEIKAGSGAMATPSSTITAHYHGTLIDGHVFDSSIQKGEPLVYPLSKLVPCWADAFKVMKVGGKAKVICPPDRAYGDRGFPPDIKPGATLIFELELLGVEEPTPAPAPAK